jgi:phenylacetate-CoA ligase
VYYETFSLLINKDYSDYDKEINNQFTTLQLFLSYAVDNSSFYSTLYRDIAISKINSIEDLKMLPIVDKEMLRQNIEEVYTISAKHGIVSFTGGTTGKSLKVIYTKDDFQRRMAYLDAFKYRLGIDTFKSKKATFSGRELTVNPKSKVFWRYNFIYKQRLYSTFDLTDANMDLYVKDLNKFKPVVINGFVSALYELAVFIDRNKCELKFKPKAIFTTSETLLTFHRELIERVFNSKIYNQYASAEGAPFITECKKGNLHYNLDTGVIETKGEDDNQMIITSFTTHGTPLIRYNIGDLITFKTGNCSCGSSHPLVEKIEGRKVDFLFSKTKGKISLSHLADVIKGNPNSVKKMQFIQDGIDDFKVNIVVDTRLYTKAHEDVILKEMKYRFGEEAIIKVNIVDDIPREKSGKFSIIKNNIKT